MFLDTLIRRNPKLIRAAVALHQAGLAPANSYLLDLDCIRANARALSAEGDRLALCVLAMTKQIGRNPAALEALRDAGVDACVAVDIDCARAIAAAGSKIGHLGHLVQIPHHQAAEAEALRPAYWTVFSMEKAREAAAAANDAGREVALLARIHAPGDMFYPGHEGGFEAGSILPTAERLDALPGARFAGVTTFPALLYDPGRRAVRPTPNLRTLTLAAETLKAAGVERVEVNAPGTTSVRTLATLAEAGATQVEPGHALTGTTPWHAVEDLPELPGMVYLSEISHQHAGRSYCFGGGLYVDPVLEPYSVTALVGRDPDEVLGHPVAARLPPANAIDYYGQLDAAARTGDTVVFGFRAQAFVTRANVVAVSGVQADSPTIEGVWSASGDPARGSDR